MSTSVFQNECECLLCSAAALECVTFCIAGSFRIGTVYLNRGGSTFTVIIIGTVVGLAVNLDSFAAASIGEAVGHGISHTFLETSAACLICTRSILSGYVNLTFGTKLIFVVDTFDC